jgi:diguanylate cyclase (GGDEF)-like protein
MELRHQLFVSFIAVVLLAMSVLGFVSYHMAGDSSVEAVRETLAGTSKVLSHYLFASKPVTAGSAGSTAVALEVEHQIVVAVNASGQPLGPLPALTQDWPLTGILAQEGMSGEFVQGDDHYVWSRVAQEGTTDYLLHVVHAESTKRAILSHLASRLSVAGILVAWVAVWVALILATVVTRRLNAQTDALRYQATHDALTGLSNRTSLNEKIDKAIRAVGHGERRVALITLDIDRFKEVNDTLGHHVGDQLLKAVGERLATTLRESDTVARVGGDEFALLLPIAELAHIDLVVNKVSQILSEPFVIEDMSLEMDATLGVSMYPDNSRDAVELVSHADVALSEARRLGERQMRYDESYDPNSVERLTLMNDLWRAARRGQFFLCYQPKVDLRSQRVVGMEALLRWQHPKNGLVPPDKFIPLAERTRAIHSISDWVLNEAMRQCAEWRADGLEMPISVNLSARMVQDTNLPEQVAQVLARHGLGAEHLVLEITETAVVSDPERALRVLDALDAMGVRLSIDDFGTGYTSLAQLKRLPVDEVKIDRAFVMNILRDANDATIVRSIIDLARNMQLVVVAEGVEHRKVLDALSELGCDVVQGYYYSRPLPAADIVHWLRAVPGTPNVRRIGGIHGI